MVADLTGIRELDELFIHWDCSSRPIPLVQLKRAIGRLALVRDDFDQHLRFHDSSYQRVLLHRGPAYEALVLCWRSGQRSPIHDHAGSACVVRVIEGVATETIFEPTPCGRLVPRRSRSAGVGSIRASFDSDVHQLANLEPPGRDLVTLHVYSPPLTAMRRYSIDETTLGVDAPAALAAPSLSTPALTSIVQPMLCPGS
jgi:cysteine dioxygenase